LRRISSAAWFGAVFHAGRFADGAIENVALQIGMELDASVACSGDVKLTIACKKRIRRVLHLTSDINGVGGHTRMLYHWIRNDRDSCHSLVVANQRDRPIPKWVSEAIRTSGGAFVVLPSELQLSEKAKWVRRITPQCADLVVLHHGANDVIPTVAYA